MSSSDFKVGDKVWVKTDINNPSVEELATIVKLPTNTTKNDTKEYNNNNNKEHNHNNNGNNNSTTITDSIVDSDIAIKSEATVSSNLTEYSE